jgi:hypothetical protein
VIAGASVKVPLFVGVNVTGPSVLGVIVKVCGEFVVRTTTGIAVERPPPEGVTVTVPLNAPFGVT